jgi:hypothetical protein
MSLSSLPTGGPSIPAGAQKVSLKAMDSASTTTKNVDVTDLSDSERKYATPPLKDGGGSSTATSTCSASGLLKSGTALATTASTVKTGWICEDYEKTYEAGKYATWSANWSYYPPAST